MKNFKTLIFSLLSILSISVFMTSCEREGIDENTNSIIPSIEIESNELVDSTVINAVFILPFGFSELNDSEIDTYINSLSYEETKLLVESRIVVKYFESLSKMDLLEDKLNYGDIAGEEIMRELLSEKEVFAYDEFKLRITAESRGCTSWRNVGSPYYYFTCYLSWCPCNVYQNQRRSCDWWCVWCNEYRRKYIRKC